MKTKKLISFFLALTLLFAVIALPISAVTPRWTNVDYIFLHHYYSDGVAKVAVRIVGAAGTTLIDDVDIKLYRVVDGILVLEGWWLNLSQTGDEFELIDEVDNVLTNAVYRLVVSADVHRNGVVETVSDYYETNY